MCHQMFSIAMGPNFHAVHPCQTQQRQHAPNIHPNVFNSFHTTVIDGESYRIFTNPFPSNNVSLHFTIEPRSSVFYPFFFIRTLKTIENQLNSYSPLPRNDPGLPDLNSDLPSSRASVCVCID